MHEEKKQSTVLEKAIIILEYLTNFPNGAALSEIASGVGMNKSTVYRILQTYKKYNYILQSSSSGYYRLGGRLLLFSPFISEFDMVASIYPYMKEYSDLTGFSTNLAVLKDFSSITVETYVPHTTSSIRIEPEKGYISKLYCCATGKVFLANMKQETLKRYLAEIKLLPMTEHTITDSDILLNDLNLVRERGYSIEMMENESHIISLASPIYNSQQEIQAALGIMLLSHTAEERNIQQIGENLSKETWKISQSLGANII